MKSLRQYFSLCGAVTLFLSASVSSATNSQPPLWQQAVQIASEEGNLIPGVVETRTEELDGKGMVKHVEETRTRVWLDEKGELQQETVTYRDGKQASENKDDEKNAEDDSENVETIPDFLKAEFQSAVTVKATGERKTINGRTCAAHEFRRKGKEGEQGVAWLDEQTGALLEVQFKPVDMPVGVKRMDNILRFAYDDKGWYLTQADIDVFASAIVFKGGARVTMNFSDHFPYVAQQ